jgi:hypothetical protein
VGSEPTISAGERPQTYAFDRAATVDVDTTFYILQIQIYLFKTLYMNAVNFRIISDAVALPLLINCAFIFPFLAIIPNS